jgi:hypothetical protein
MMMMRAATHTALKMAGPRDSRIDLPSLGMRAAIPAKIRAGRHHQHDDYQREDRPLRDDLVADGTALQQSAVGRQRDDAGGLQDGQRDREVAGVLGHLGLAGLTLLAQLLEPWDHNGEQLHDDARGDVGHHADREHGQLQQRTTGEEVDERINLRVLAAAELADALVDVDVVDPR